MASRQYWRSSPALSDQKRSESLTKLKPLTSQQYETPLLRSRSKPHTVWLGVGVRGRARVRVRGRVRARARVGGR